MFVRWKRSRDPRYHVTRYRAYLARSVRIDGKPRQEQHYLAGYSEYDADWLPYQSKLAKNESKRRALFWQQVRTALFSMNLTSDERLKIAEKLAERVVPTRFSVGTTEGSNPR